MVSVVRPLRSAWTSVSFDLNSGGSHFCAFVKARDFGGSAPAISAFCFGQSHFGAGGNESGAIGTKQRNVRRGPAHS